MQDIWNVRMEFKKKRKKEEVPEQLKEGGGAGASPFCTLHRGSNRLKAGWERHLVLWIPHKRADYRQDGEDWESGIFSWHDTWYSKIKYDYMWIKMHFHASLLLFFIFLSAFYIYKVKGRSYRIWFRSPTFNFWVN